ncbi:MAG: 3-oxoacyl-ACP synthase, partial [Myxococcales bacterium]|nr:3-oxoacyl-ACP synthase [Myxococcales bacterium]
MDQPTSRTPVRLLSGSGMLLDGIARGEFRVAVTFAGQGVGWIDDLAELDRALPSVRRLVDAADATLVELGAERAFAWSGHLPSGWPLARWVRDPAARPATHALAGTVVSQPGIFLAQVARWVWLVEQGFGAAFAAGHVVALTGHSQGVMAALLAAESPRGNIAPERLQAYVRAMAWQALSMAQSAGPHGVRTDAASPMAAVAGPDLATLEALVARATHGFTGAARPVVALHNTRTRHVASGPVTALRAVHAALETTAKREADLRKQGRLGGRPLQFTWEWLDVGAPFHGPAMADGLTAMLAQATRDGFSIPLNTLCVPVLSPATARPYATDEVVGEVLADEFVRPVRWSATVAALAALADVVLDLGPGDGVAKLAAANLRGSGRRVVPLGTSEGRRLLLDRAGPGPLPDDWSEARPRLVRRADHSIGVANRFTAATGQPPVLLPGMTPTTSDAPIVAAAANAGFWSELAGGGQPTENILRLRLDELTGLLEPGRGFIFNALFLDPWLWDLQIRRGLLVKARAAGVPIDGITVSAGIPEVADAVRWVRQWQAAGIRHIAFKPGTLAQIEQVCRIARELADVTLFAHVEGGKAGGHHSWEDLD